MQHRLIPEGWEYVTSDPHEDDAWRLAVEYKQMHERVRGDLFVRVKVVWAKQPHVYWILRRLEAREGREAA